MDFVRALWRGDVSLVTTYWIFGVLAGLLFRLAFVYIEYQRELFTSGLGPFLVLCFVGWFFAYSVFMSVAIWRSANRYPGAKQWALLAKIAVVFGVMALLKSALDMFGVR